MTLSAVRSLWTWTTSQELERVAALELPQHAHDRRDAAAGADEEETRRQGIRQPKQALHPTEVDGRPRLDAAGEVGRHPALGHVLDGDRDQAVGMVGVGRQRVGAPVPAAVDRDADPQVLTGLVAGPLVRGADHDRRGLGRLGTDLLDRPLQLAGRPERVHQRQVVVGEQRRRPAARALQQAAVQRLDLRCRSSFDHYVSQINATSFDVKVTLYFRILRPSYFSSALRRREAAR